MSGKLQEAYDLIQSSDFNEAIEGINKVEEMLGSLDEKDYLASVDVLLGVFYIDPYDRPDLKPLVDRASEVLIMQKEKALGPLVESLAEADMKFNFNVSRTLAKMGAPALGKLINYYEHTDDEQVKAFIVYAIGKIKDPVVSSAATLLIKAAGESNKEIRDSAVRTLGKITEIIEPGQISSVEKDKIVDVLSENAGDVSPSIRSKAFRSLGKMAEAGFLSDKQSKSLASRANRVLGNDANFNWDNAYIVRKEAQFALRCIK
jgi:HEAT repeat protein